MPTFDYVLAASILAASGGDHFNASPEKLSLLMPAVQQLAIKREILDPRETPLTGLPLCEVVHNMKRLRRRSRELADAPPLNDCYRFPDRDHVSTLLSFNRSYRQHLETQQAVDTTQTDRYRQAIQETDRLYQIWDLVRDARCNYYYITVRRQALKQLREMIGEDAYFAGTLPPPVPLWRFARQN